jgi:hypothetical protein
MCAGLAVWAARTLRLHCHDVPRFRRRQPGARVPIRNARTCGKQLGRPRRVVDEVRRLRSEGASLRQIAEKLGLGCSTVRLSLAHSGELKTPS